jgi:hypothetical protein
MYACSCAETVRDRPARLLGGDPGLDDELSAALAALPGIALLAPAHAADADVLLAADSRTPRRRSHPRRAFPPSRCPCLGGRSTGPGGLAAEALIVAPSASSNVRSTGLHCDKPWPRRLLRSARLLNAGAEESHVALLGAGGGWERRRAPALASAHDRSFVLDLALAMGDAEVAERSSRAGCPAPTCLRTCRDAGELVAGFAHGEACRARRTRAARAGGSDRRARDRACRSRDRGRPACDCRLRRAPGSRDGSVLERAA